MGLAYSGGTIVNTQHVVPAGTKRETMLEFLDTQLAAAGWTVTEELPYMEVGGTAANTNTITTDNGGGAEKVYTFQDTLSDVDGNVHVGASAAESLQNLRDAINLGAGAGTAYAASMSANTGVSADPNLNENSSRLVIRGLAEGNRGDAVAESGALTMVPNSGLLVWYGKKFVSAQTAAFQQATLIVEYEADSANENMFFKLCDRDNKNCATASQLGGNGSDSPGFVATTVYNLHAGKYWFYFYIPSNTDNATCVMVQAPHIPAFLAPKKITGATNASPIVITTSTAHGYSNGETVKCLYVAGNTAANAQATVSNVTTYTFELDGTTGNGTFSGTLGLCGRQDATARELIDVTITSGSAPIGAPITFRESANGWGYLGANLLRNGSLHVYSTSTNKYRMLAQNTANIGMSVDLTWEDDSYLLSEPWMALVTAVSGSSYRLGVQLWNTFFVQRGIVDEATVVSVDSHNWINVMNTNVGNNAAYFPPLSIWVTTT